MFCQGNSFAESQWSKAEPAGTRSGSDIDTYVTVNNSALDRLLYDHREGCAISYASASSLSVAIGTLALPNAGGTVVKWRRNTAATTVDWDDIDTGVEAVSQTYYVYGVADTDATTYTFLVSTSSTTPTGATYYRRIGTFYNNSSGDIEQVTNDSDYFKKTYDSGWFAVAIATAYSKTHSLGTTNVLYALYFTTDSGGANPVGASGIHSYNGVDRGIAIKTLTNTTVKVQMPENEVYYGFGDDGEVADHTETSGYARLVMYSLE